jgi:hypothetical protein
VASFSSEEASLKWLEECSGMLERKAAGARTEAAEGDSQSLDLLRAVQARTTEEVAVEHVGPAMSTETLLREFSTEAGFLVRVAPTFGIWQGIKMTCDASWTETPLLFLLPPPSWCRTKRVVDRCNLQVDLLTFCVDTVQYICL